MTGVLGGFVQVDLGGVIAGLPLKDADWRPPADPAKLLHQTLELKITALNPERGNVIVSRLALLQERREARRRELREGQVVEATVKGLAPFGAFVDLGGLDAMLHRTELADGPPFPEPEVMLRRGQQLRVRVLKLGTQIHVSLRNTSQD